MATAANDRDKALEAALSQIDRQFGRGSVMRLGQDDRPPAEVIPTGSIALDIALGITSLDTASCGMSESSVVFAPETVVCNIPGRYDVRSSSPIRLYLHSSCSAVGSTSSASVDIGTTSCASSCA